MKIKQILTVTVMLVLSGLFSACPEPPDNPPEPYLTMKQLMVSDTSDALDNQVKRFTFVFHLIDGDGNVGLKTGDTLGVFHPDTIFHYNCFLNLYKVENQDTSLVELGAPLQYRIPYIEPEGGNKNLEADIYLNVDMTVGTVLPDYETIMFDLYIFDRDFNKSNIIQSPVVPTEGTGVYSPGQ
jgi:hypothetical protein